MDFSNDFCFSGKVKCLSPMTYQDGFYGGSMTLEGKSKRHNANYTKICNLGFLVPSFLWNKVQAVGVEMTVAGHFETWTINKEREDGSLKTKQKTVHVVDQIID